MNNKKFLFALVGALAVAATTYARPAPGPGRHGGHAPMHHVAKPAYHHHGGYHRPPPRHHHSHDHGICGLGLAAGIVQTVANIIAPQPTVVAAPVVYQAW